MEEISMNRPTPAQKRCPYCGRHYTPYIRAAGTQKSCGRAACRKKHKLKTQIAWLERNPDYFRGRYIKVKCWRESHPGYQKEYRAAHPEHATRDNRARVARWRKRKRFRSDIQDGLRLKVDGILRIMSG